ncbi:intraflagellar transport protein 20 homolog [Homarus americanus]|uniref:Intraflagellar transport protein 20-like n=1 Tax=Homarus americanus TaxID=6706 RepID=A0A8J5MSF9_HOMAM|nr:intraflagellar transport protein 20 homolog [Homarus americanus]KAG7161842.1 Intraflagellar transport protein 20-like [Homarus americanus]
MADETLAKAGLYFDELNKIRVLEPEVAQQTSELKDECKEFVDKIRDFHERADHFIQVADNLSAAVESEKMRAIGSRNLIKSMSKQREAQQQQLLALIGEKKLELERLRVQYESLQRTEAEQLEFIEQFIMQK